MITGNHEPQAEEAFVRTAHTHTPRTRPELLFVSGTILSAVLSKREIQITGILSCSSIVPIPTSDASVTSAADLFSINGLTPMSLIGLCKVLSHSSVHRHSSDDGTENSSYAVAAKVERIEGNSEDIQ